MLDKINHTAGSHVDALFSSLPQEFQVWMSHGDQLLDLPKDFITIGKTVSAPLAAIAHSAKPYFGIQFHPEVTHTPLGGKIIANFAVEVCRVRQDWKMENFVQREIERIRQLVGETGEVVGAVSGGVDSTVAAKLMHEAIGPRFHAILVDNGLLRLNEAEQVKETLQDALGINLNVADASKDFLGRLAGVEDPEKKRKIIGNTFIEVFEREAEAIDKKSGGKIDWLLQGTLYPDVIESVSFRGPSQTIKTHHVRMFGPRNLTVECRWVTRGYEAETDRASQGIIQRFVGSSFTF
jgi:GMP synthase (glutamine-hydrolysing)